MDYQGNSKKNKQKKDTNQKDDPKPEKKIERVTSGEVVIQKKTMTSRIKSAIITVDLGTVIRNVIQQTAIPAARNWVYDVLTNTIGQAIYGEQQVRRGPMNLFGGPRYNYQANNPISRPYSQNPIAPAITQGPRTMLRNISDNFILTSREEAERVVEVMNEVVDQFEVVTVGDLYELVGAPSTHTDQKWGWTRLGDVPIRQVRDGYIIDLPTPEAVQQ